MRVNYAYEEITARNVICFRGDGPKDEVNAKRRAGNLPPPRVERSRRRAGCCRCSSSPATV